MLQAQWMVGIESLEGKRLICVPGIEVADEVKLKDNGCETAQELFGRWLMCRKNQNKFGVWLRDRISCSDATIQRVHMAFEQWAEHRI